MKMKKIGEKISDALEIDREVLLNIPKITLAGREEAYVENFKGILKYGSETLRLSANGGDIEINGAELELKYIKSDEIAVIGDIKSVVFL